MPSKNPITVHIPDTKPIRIHIPPAFRHHNTQIKTFLLRNKQYTSVAVASFIFYPLKAHIRAPTPFCSPNNRTIGSNAPSNTPTEPAQLLLVQRTRTHITSDRWEVPWGISDKLDDPTYLHTVARKTFEVTGLRVRRFLRQIGDGEEFTTSEGTGLRLHFEVEAAELADAGKTLECPGLGQVHVELDPDEHQEFVWATEDDIIGDIFPAVSPQQKEVMLRAFQLRRGDEEERRALVVKSSREQRQAGLEACYARDLGEDDDDGGEEKDDEQREEGADLFKLTVKKSRLSLRKVR